MNGIAIARSLSEAGYDVTLTDDGKGLAVEFGTTLGRVVLDHQFPTELLRPPKFFLAESPVPKLGHVGIGSDGSPREVCVGDPYSTAVNIDRRDRVYAETVREAVGMLKRMIEDPPHNRQELLREFHAHWRLLCRGPSGPNEIFVAWEAERSETLQLRRPSSGSPDSSLVTAPVAIASSAADAGALDTVRKAAQWTRRPVVGKAVALRLEELEPAPAPGDDLLCWIISALTRVTEDGRQILKRLRKRTSRDFWLVFSGPTSGGDAMFAVHLRSRVAAVLPRSPEAAKEQLWTLTPYSVRPISQATLVPRGGGSLDLRGKSVLLVGCGSVGSELAVSLASAGVGRLTLSDPDLFSEKNLYRHVLSVGDIGKLKSTALASEIVRKHPWANVTPWAKPLEKLRDEPVLQSFDLIVIAIGSPNVERAFAEYCQVRDLRVPPVLNCWLEGHGIGGHATLALPTSVGCWYCAYVDPETLTRGLVSNLNFIKPGQVVLRKQGGCGTQFLPYSGVAARITASMAADLAVRCLTGDATASSKVSWKGCDAAAREAGLALTWRYRHFNASLQVLDLHNPDCDVCGG